MARSIIPVHIRPHLVPFLFREFPGTQANFQGKKVKAVKVSTRNTFGKLIRLLAVKSDTPSACDKRYAIFLSINEEVRKKEYFGKVYRYSDGRSSFLKIPDEGVKMINDHLEGMFRSSMMCFLSGWEAKEGQDSETLLKGINLFVERYNLLEFGFDPSSIRRNYYRWKEKEEFLSFFANQPSNRVHNY